MSIALIILGFTLVVCGVFFAVKGFGTAQAGGSAVKSFSIQGPSWLILVALGAGVIAFGAWLYKENPNDQIPPAPAPVTSVYEPFDYGDDPYLDGLYESCEQGSMSACDTLYSEAPLDSNYEAFGKYCGYIVEYSVPPADYGGTCSNPNDTAVVG